MRTITALFDTYDHAASAVRSLYSFGPPPGTGRNIACRGASNVASPSAWPMP